MATILLVEDHADILKGLTIALTQRGYEVDGHADGESALEAIKSSWPEIAIIDSGLPGISGHELARVIDRQTGDRKRIFKVLFTGTDSKAIREESREAGFDMFAPKPILINHFCEELSRLSRESP